METLGSIGRHSHRRIAAWTTTVAILACLSAAAPRLAAQPHPTQGAALPTELLQTELLPDLQLSELLTGLETPTSLANAGDERLFIGLRDGRILIFADGALRPTPFLDIREQVRFENNLDGFYSFAFHPDYAGTEFLFVLYVNRDLQTVISRFTVSKDPNFVDPATEVVLLSIDQSIGQHDGNHLAFGPDGFLYISTGESGPGFDPLCLAQDLGSLQGKILRIDVDQGAAVPPFHSIPAANPFVGVEGAADEIWALGLRNPWRFSFDRTTGDLWIGDVGEDSREEVNLQPAGDTGGRNYGWKTLEGTLCLENTAGCASDPPPCDSPAYTPPVLEYETGESCAVIGGFVYRGDDLPGLDGAYLHGDFCSGILWAAVQEGETWVQMDTTLRVPTVTAFGEDAQGEIYVLTTDGRLLGLEPGSGNGSCEQDTTTLCLNDGRFRTRATWRVADGEPTDAEGSNLTGDGGFFWFFGENNPELFVKVLDACDGFDHYWVFIAGLTDVETRIEVLDTQTGATRTYEKALGANFDPVYDTFAFSGCP